MQQLRSRSAWAIAAAVVAGLIVLGGLAYLLAPPPTRDDVAQWTLERYDDAQLQAGSLLAQANVNPGARGRVDGTVRRVAAS